MKLSTSKDEFLIQKINELDQYVDGAYAPYSNFKVACALIDQSHNSIKARNIENASYGLSMCAERCAIYAAMAADFHLENVEILIVYHRENIVSMCGACVQVACELLNKNTRIIMASHEEYKEVKLYELFPYTFQGEDLR